MFFLPTKLYCPRLPAQQVVRGRLLAQLNQGLTRGHRLTLVVAPAGFGKTTLISQWTSDIGATEASDNWQSNWLSLDEFDNELSVFLGYVAAAIQQVFPSACANTASLARSPQLPAADQLAAVLLQDLAALDQPSLLILDDYHVIVETTIHQIVSRLIDHLPPNVHLVITTRTEPPLSLSRLRVRQAMTELRAADLYFSDAETQRFFARSLGDALPQDAVAALRTETEGWAAGLQLAALSLRGREDPPAFARTVRRGNQHVMNYLLEEVLECQTPAVQFFLVCISVLDRFSASLCEAVLGEDLDAYVQESDRPEIFGAAQPPAAAQAILDYLIQTNLFIVPLDGQGHWYRYHHLFRDLLYHQLQIRRSKAEIAMLHRRASAWLANHRLIDEAVQHLVAAGDELAAAQLVEQHRHEPLDQEEWRTLERWLAHLPGAWIEQRPALLLAKAWVLVFQRKLANIPPLVEAAEACFDAAGLTEHEARVVRGEINTLRAYVWSWEEEDQRSLAAAQRALKQLPGNYLYVRSGALHIAGLAYQLLGQPDDGIQTLQNALAAHGLEPNTFTARILFTLVAIHCRRGELAQAQATTRTFTQIARQAQLHTSGGWGHFFLGLVSYEWNELEQAAHHFGAIVEQRFTLNSHIVQNGWLGLALTYQAQGQFEVALQQTDALIEFHLKMNNLFFLPIVHSLQARLALLQGDLLTAGRWAQATTLEPMLELTLDSELPWLTRIQILVRQATEASLAEAQADLARLQQVAQSRHIPLRLIPILALRALAEASQNQTDQALETLAQAINLGKTEHFIRTFVDLGPRMARLLYQLADRGVETVYLGEILAAFPPGLHADDPAQLASRVAQENPIEPLTERELEVVTLLAQRLSNREIAQSLTISPLTVRTHATNLYRKLGVNSRKQAVARARTLGLLPAE